MDLSAVSAALGAVVLERVSRGRFVRRSAAPSWWRMRVADSAAAEPIAIAEVFPFLDVFLPAAEHAWAAAKATPIASEMWTEIEPSGNEIHLEAFATRTFDAAVLVIARNDQGFRERQLLLQRARELRVTYDALMREIERKDILLHTIVHDLTAPLHSIMGSLSLLRECELSAAATRWTQLAMDAATRQRELIHDILDVFVAEQGEGAAESTLRTDLHNAIERAVTEREPVARQHRIALVAELEDVGLVAADETRLIRVLTNLLDNAIKHSPPGSRVLVKSASDDGAVRITVEDEGSGVAPDVMSRLFQKFAHDPRERGTGLGLYFCRITLEQWGGGIGYEPGTPVGARFWIRLPIVPTEHDHQTRSDAHAEIASAR